MQRNLPLTELRERHDREKHAFFRLTAGEQARAQAAALAYYSENPWAFLSDCVFTLDQVDADDPIKPFPSYREYLQFLAGVWLSNPLLAIPKSRRMTCSWAFISLFTHDTIFRKGRFNGFVSKKEDDASELVARAEFIYRNIPEWRIPRPLLPVLKNGKMSKQPPIMEFEETNSKIQGFPMGSDQLRQFTLSGILGDECAFWPEAQKFYSASKPTIDGGGRITLISSRSPGFFKKIVFDQLDAQDLNFPEEPPAEIKTPLEGVEVWKNPRNRFVVVDLHYTADPDKRGKEWYEATKASMPIKDFLMEYEKSWDTYEGKPVYEDFLKHLHATKGPLDAEPGGPLLLGVDFGLTPAVVLGQLVGSQLRVLKEYVELDGSINKLAPRVWADLRINYPAWANNPENIIAFIDPAGFTRAQTDARTCADVLRKNGFLSVRPGPVPFDARRIAVETFLLKHTKEGPGLLLKEQSCPVLLQGFLGGYHYPENVTENEPDRLRPVKNAYSHPHDALQYLCAGAIGLRRSYGLKTGGRDTLPNYGFQRS